MLTKLSAVLSPSKVSQFGIHYTLYGHLGSSMLDVNFEMPTRISAEISNRKMVKSGVVRNQDWRYR